MDLIDFYFKAARADELSVDAIDIKEHMETLKYYGEGCSHITEMGVRGIVSTWAFLAAHPKTLISIDITNPAVHGGNLALVERAAKQANINFRFILGDTRKLVIDQTDLLFIDTDHKYDQLTIELNCHAKFVNKYIIMHDTYLFPELARAIEDWLENNLNWEILEIFAFNNGLTILRRINKKDD